MGQKSKPPARRKFLKNGAALAGLAMASALPPASGQTPEAGDSTLRPKDTRLYGERSRFETTARLPDNPSAYLLRAPLQDSMGIITASSLHMMRAHGNRAPDIDPSQHRLLIHGMVERPLIFTMDEIKRFPSVSRIHFLACAGNSYLNADDRKNSKTVQQTHGKTSCAEWTGVLLSVLLKEAGLQNGASWIVAEGSEGMKWARSTPLRKAMDDAIVAYGQNGEALRPEQGYPVRLIVPGFEGGFSPKWLRRIQVGSGPFMTRPETSRYVNHRPDGREQWFNPELEPNSVITRPSGGQQLTDRGFCDITGLAWSGGGAVRRVEVSTDGGKSWKDAQLQEPILRFAHTRFRFPWHWNGEEAVLQSRCTDERGEVQPSVAELTKLWGVNREYWLSSPNAIQHINFIQPWKVTREGSVQNAIWEV